MLCVCFAQPLAAGNTDTRVPFLVRWPGVARAGQTTGHPCWRGDFIPTLAEHLSHPLGASEASGTEWGTGGTRRPPAE